MNYVNNDARGFDVIEWEVESLLAHCDSRPEIGLKVRAAVVNTYPHGVDVELALPDGKRLVHLDYRWLQEVEAEYFWQYRPELPQSCCLGA